jgi:hypothetical protein
MKQAYVKDSDVRIKGTLDLTPGCANVDGFDANFEPVWEGGTTMYWDDQYTQTNGKGEKLYVGEDGGTYAQSDLELRDVESKPV